MAAVVVHLPPSESSRANQAAVETIFGNTPRIVVASIIAFLFGTFVNSYVLAKMKIWTRGRWLWSRIIGAAAQLVAALPLFAMGRARGLPEYRFEMAPTRAARVVA